MYKIYRNNKRYGKKTFSSYEDARKYVRRKITQIFCYSDSIGKMGFHISA